MCITTAGVSSVLDLWDLPVLRYSYVTFLPMRTIFWPIFTYKMAKFQYFWSKPLHVTLFTLELLFLCNSSQCVIKCGFQNWKYAKNGHFYVCARYKSGRLLFIRGVRGPKMVPEVIISIDNNNWMVNELIHESRPNAPTPNNTINFGKFSPNSNK